MLSTNLCVHESKFACACNKVISEEQWHQTILACHIVWDTIAYGNIKNDGKVLIIKVTVNKSTISFTSLLDILSRKEIDGIVFSIILPMRNVNPETSIIK